jgi:hypothetical protein
MRFVTWNVGHQTRRRPLPVGLANALAELEPDVVVLTEYVSDDSHAPFLGLLKQRGLSESCRTEPVKGQNQVLIVARNPLTTDNTVRCTELSAATVPNWLHVCASDVDVVGFRVPMFNGIRRGRTRYWEWLQTTLASLANRPSVLLGDFNATRSFPPLSKIVADGWQLATPSDGWSYRGKTGTSAAIDHGLVSRHFRVVEASYMEKQGTVCFAGVSGAYSDHAVLRFDVELVRSAKDVPGFRGIGTA